MAPKWTQLMSKAFSHCPDTLNYSLVYIIRLFFLLSPLLHCPLRSLCLITFAVYVSILCHLLHLFKAAQLTANISSSHSSLLLPPLAVHSTLLLPSSDQLLPLSHLSRNAGLLMTSLRFVSQLAPTAVDYLNISIQRRRHLRDSPRPLLFGLDAQTPCDVTHAWILTSARMLQPALSFSTTKKITVSPFNSRICQSCLKYWWLVGTVEGCVWDLQIVAASS